MRAKQACFSNVSSHRKKRWPHFGSGAESMIFLSNLHSAVMNRPTSRRLSFWPGAADLKKAEPEINHRGQGARRKILFYHKHHPHYGFTNFSAHPVVYDGKVYPTSEHLFQCFKVSSLFSSIAINWTPLTYELSLVSRPLPRNCGVHSLVLSQAEWRSVTSTSFSARSAAWLEEGQCRKGMAYMMLIMLV